LLMNAPAMMEALVNRLSYLAPYLVLDLGAGLTPLTQKLLPACNILLVLVEPVTNPVIHCKALITDLADLTGSQKNIHAVVVNRIRSDTQINMSQIEELLGQTPLIAITPAPELLYEASRMKTSAVSSRPDSLTAQQFARLAAAVLNFEKEKKK
jgi:MinD-like ATPase involved in chromosome partitioning or flagellar assembly